MSFESGLIDQQSIIMGCVAQTKAQALSLIARELLSRGLVSENYEPALLARESQISTYLGQGIAIPHGTLADKNKIAKTGVLLVHFADGVDWGEGQIVYLAVAIVANNDEHLSILRQLTQCLDDDALPQKLKIAKTTDELIHALFKQSHLIDTAPKPSCELSLPACYRLQINAQDLESALVQACEFLRQQSAVSSGFLSSILSKTPIDLGGVLVVQTDKAVLKAAVLGLAWLYDNAYTKQLLIVADKHSDRQFLSQLLDKIIAFAPNNYDDWARIFWQSDEFFYEQVMLYNRHGLHARPATVLSQLAQTFDEPIDFSVDGEHFVCGKSLIKLLGLGATYGTKLYIRTPKNNNAHERLSVIAQAILGGLGEKIEKIEPTAAQIHPLFVDQVNDTANQVFESTLEVDDASLTAIAVDESASVQLIKDQKYYGMIASKGLCIAQAYVVAERELVFERLADNPEEQKQQLNHAISLVNQQLQTAIDDATSDDIAQIFTAHQVLLNDNELIAGVYQRIDEGFSAAMAWQSEIDALVGIQAGLSDPVLALRADDFKDIGQRVLMALCEVDYGVPQGDYVLVKDDILPSDMTRLGKGICAIVTASGGINSHSAIIARSLGVPALVAMGGLVLKIEQGQTLLVDAEEGYMVIEPNPSLIEHTQERLDQFSRQQQLAKQSAHEIAQTQDGHQVEVAVNLGDVTEVTGALALGAEAVGLLRTEFVFMRHTALPTIESQIIDYAQVFEPMNGRPVVVRTLDVGGDKPLPYLTMNKEDNPFLGVRGVRLTLRRVDIFKDQLTALIQASNQITQKTGVQQDLRIMFPMIAQMQEWRQAKAILDEVLQSHPHPKLQVGMMIEVPSAAIMADKFAKEVDFFSIGTNDLVQYALAIDRGHPSLSAQADGLNPAILRLIDQTIKSAHANNKWVGVCGELAADEKAVPILLGLGVDELSVSAAAIPAVKMQIRTLTLTKCKALATAVLALNTASEVRSAVSHLGVRQ